MTDRISVVIPVYNGATHIEDCLRALASQSLSRDLFEVTVVDDGSQDDSAARAERLGARVIRQENRGAPAARNVGIGASRHPWVAFTDCDCIPTRHWLAHLSRAVGDVQRGSDPLGAAGRLVGYSSDSRPARFVDLTKGLDAERHLSHPKWPFAPTANVMYRRDALLEVGGFDERFVAYDACDLHTRLHGRDRDFRFEPRAVVLHRHRASWWDYYRQQLGYGRGLGQFTLRYRQEIEWSLWSELRAWGQLAQLAGRSVTSGEGDEALVVRGNTIKALAQRIGYMQAYWNPAERLRWKNDPIAAAHPNNATS